MKPLLIRGAALGDGRRPLLCAPLVGADRAALLAEAAAAVAAGADLVEWRVDHFGAVGDTREVLATGAALRGALAGRPILFTCRAPQEGGRALALEAARVGDLYCAAIEAGCAELVDLEQSREAALRERVRAAARALGVGLVLSFHDFERTPGAAELAARFRAAQELGGDVAKVAVMPRSTEDLLVLLGATLEASRRLDIPVIGMSMGAEGAVTRSAGFLFGSALSFGVAAASSAPGQMPLADLRRAVELLARARDG